MTVAACRFDRTAFLHQDGAQCELPPVDHAGHAFVYLHPCPTSAITDPGVMAAHGHWCVPAAEAEGVAETWDEVLRAITATAARAGVATRDFTMSGPSGIPLGCCSSWLDTRPYSPDGVAEVLIPWRRPLSGPHSSSPMARPQ